MKVGAKESMTTEEINAVKKKPNTFNRDKKKDASKAFQKSARPNLPEGKGAKL